MKRAALLISIFGALTFAGCAWDNENVQRPNGGNTSIDPAVDSDGDTISDYDEGVLMGTDTDGDTVMDYLDLDSDGDTVGDAIDVSPQGGQDTKTKNGEACQENSECQSGNCFMNQVCRTTSWKNADNKSCFTNDHCASGLCVNSICQSKNSGSDNGGSSNGGSSNGSACAVNSDCKSKLCVNSKCVAISGNGVNGSNSTGLGSGVANSSCSLNRDCESGLCDGGKCVNDCSAVGCSEPYTVCRYNKCIPVDVIGDECKESSDCSTGYNCCNGFCIAGTCEPGVMCDFISLGYDVECSANCEYSTWGYMCGCSRDAQCGNGYYCSGDDICTPKRTVGSACEYNTECQSDACISGTCHQKRDDGEYCDYHAWCKSGTCYDTSKERLAEISDAFYNSDETYCIPKLKSGEECLYDMNCVSDHCYQNKCK